MSVGICWYMLVYIYIPVTRVVPTQVPIFFPLSLGPQDPLIMKLLYIKWIDLRSRNPAVFGLPSEGSFDVMLLMVG